MNLSELLKIANSKGYSGTKSRKDVIDFLCKKKKEKSVVFVFLGHLL